MDSPKPENRAAFLTSSRQKPLSIRPATYTSPGANEILIRNHAIGINHIDWKIQDHEFAPFKYPGVLGHESAGDVVEVGSSVTRFRVGDRVLAEGTCMGTQRPEDGSFQLYTVVPEHVASPIPDSMAYADAAVLPLGVSTAIMGLYAPDTLELAYPTLDAQPRGQTVVVWGGSSSVGSNVIQLAAHAGYDVVAVASAHNAHHVTQLGASAVLDYHKPSIVEDLVAALQGKTVKGAFDAIGRPETTVSLARVVEQTDGEKRLVSVLPAPDLPADIRFRMAWAVVSPPELGFAVYRDFLPHALAGGAYVPFPTATVAGEGLEQIQQGMDVLSRGVSAKKLVITL